MESDSKNKGEQGIRLYNTQSRKIDQIIPEHGKKIRIFVCGPTVYDYIHIGNARTFVFFDSLVRYLRSSGYLVFYLQNITDVDDKIINKAREEKKDVMDVSSFYLSEFIRDMNSLRVESVNLYARTSLFIGEVIEQIERLIKSGHAYVSDDGVYFSVSSFPDYGKLSGQKIDNLIAGARVTADRRKKNPEDFVLWKFRKTGEPFWWSPWGEGRPGWHIEDTAITEFFFGKSYDVHGGGIDLLFPHHESENAQMRSISGMDYLAKYWIHVGMLSMGEGKMSKSVGNIIKVRDILSEFSAEDIRFFLLNSGYRNTIEFSMKALRESSVTRKRIQNLYDILTREHENSGLILEGNEETERIWKELEDDFDTRSFFRDLLAYVSRIFKDMENLGKDELGAALYMLTLTDSVFCILKGREASSDISDFINSMIELRNQMRKVGKFDVSDMIRKALEDAGVVVEDSKGETKWRMS